MSPTTAPLGLGPAGCGDFGAYAPDAVAGRPGPRPAADPDPVRAKALGARHGVPAPGSLAPYHQESS